MKYLLKGIYRVLVLCSAIAFIGCSSDGSELESVPETMVGIATRPASGQPTSTAIDESCEAPEPESTAPEPDNSSQPLPLAVESQRSDTLKTGESQIYKIVSGAHISLVSNNGYADLILFDELEDIDIAAPFVNGKSLCFSTWVFKEDLCSASTDDGELYALVVANQDTDYRISSTSECSIQTVNRWVYRNMLDYYLYADQVPVINPDTYTDPEDLVRDTRFESLDPFSSIRDAAAQTSFFEDGVTFGLGFNGTFDDDGNLRIIFVHNDSPFGRAGAKRGDIAISINDELFADLPNSRFSELVGTRESPLMTNWKLIDADTGQDKTISVISAEYSINTVVYSEVLSDTAFNGTVGYLVFSEFLAPSVDELNATFELFKEQGVSELVLDLRYNGGGQANVTRRLASQIAGPIIDGKLQSREEHNTEYSRFNYANFYSEASPSLDLSRLIVLTTESSASASERLINGLRPYIEVVTIGTTTRGKAFSSSGRQYCGKVLNAMQTQGVNSAGVSVAGGINADCFASDDTANNFGIKEGMLKGALDYLSEGTCLTEPVVAARSANATKSKLALTPYPESEERLLFENIFD